MQILHISERGIGVLRGMPRLLRVLLENRDTKEDPSAARRLERAEKEAALATTEVERDFPVLHGFAVVALWSWLEHFVKGFLALWVVHRREAVDAPALQRLRVKLGDYLRLRKVEQAQYLVDLLEQELASPLKRGVDRFESLLEPFGLSFPFPENGKKALFELQQLRNAIAHRSGRADRRLRADCPWLKLKLNQPIHVSGEMLRSYAGATDSFLLAFLYRVGDVHGVDLRVKSVEAPAPKGSPPGSRAELSRGKA